MYRYFLITICLLVTTFVVNAQVIDTTGKKSTVDPALQAKRDSLRSNLVVPKVKKEKVYNPDSTHSPVKAVMHSLMIPGWGQVYNRRWWKVPVIYGGLGLIAWAYLFNRTYYDETLNVVRFRNQGKVPAPGTPYYKVFNDYAPYSTQTLTNAVLGARRNRDLSIIGFCAAWGIQIIDAYIDAKFIHSYTMDDNLTFKVKPTVLGQPMLAGNFNGSVIPGLKITFTFN